MTAAANASTRFVASPIVRFRRLDDELILYHSGTNEVTNLDRIGSLVWDLLAEPASAQELAADLAPAFGQSESVITTDLVALLTDLLEAQLVERVGAPGNSDQVDP